MTLPGSTIWREYATDGVAASGANQPNKSDIRAWAKNVEDSISACGSSGGTVNAQVPTWTPALSSVPPFFECASVGPNTSTTVTVNPQSLGALTVVRNGAALAIGDTGPVGYILLFETLGTTAVLLNPYTAPASVNRAESGAVAEPITARMGRVLRVTDFGAVPDYYTDSTAAIVNAINAAVANNIQDIYVPCGAGPYLTDTVVLGGGQYKGIRFIGEGFNSKGVFFPTAGFAIKPGATGNKDLFRVQSGGAGAYDLQGYVTFENLGFLIDHSVNPSQTAGWLINVLDEASGTYPVGVKIRKCNFQGGVSGGIYIGQKRQSSLYEVNVYGSGSGTGSAGIKINTYDCVLSDINVGGCAGIGVQFVSGAQINCRNVASYNNYVGVEIDAAATDIQWSGGSVDHNLTYGIVSYASSSTTYKAEGRNFHQTKFLQNGTSGTTFYDVIFQDADLTTTFVQCYFDGHAEDAVHTEQAPFAFVSSSARVRAIGCTYQTSKYVLGAISNNATCISDTAGKTL